MLHTPTSRTPFYYFFVWQDFLHIVKFRHPCVHISVTIDGHNRRWIDTDTIDRYCWSCWPPIVSIHRLKIFSHWSLYRSSMAKSWSKRWPSIQRFIFNRWYRSIGQKSGYPAHFSKWRKARKYSSIIDRAKYDGLLGLCRKICCSKTVKMKKAEVFLQ